MRTRSRTLAWTALCALLVAGGALRLQSLRGTSLWFDEIITLHEARRPSLRGAVGIKATHPPLMRISARWSTTLFGDPHRPGGHDFALRLPSAAMGTVAIAFVFLMARRLSDGNALVGLVAAAAWALLPYGIWYSSEARFYAALVLFTSWAVHATAVFEQRARRWTAAYLALPLLLGLYTHYMFAFVFISTAALSTPAILRNRRWIHLAPWLTAGLLFLPWGAFALANLEYQGRAWIRPLEHQLPEVVIRFFTGRLGYFHLTGAGTGVEHFRQQVLWGATALLLGGFVVHLVRRRSCGARQSAVIVVPALVLIALLHDRSITTRFFHPKYLAWVHPFASLALGELAALLVCPALESIRNGLQRARAKRARTGRRAGRGVLAAAAGSAIAFAGAPVGRAVAEAYERMDPASPRALHRQQYHEAAEWLAEQRGDDEPVFVLDCHRRYNRLAVRYYGLEDPIEPLSCGGGTRTCPSGSESAERAWAMLTHWSSDEALDGAIRALESCYGRIRQREELGGVEGRILLLSMEAEK